MASGGCTVCSHSDREAIDAALAGGQSQRAVARGWPDLSKDAVRRHATTHLSAALVRVKARREEAGAMTALARLERLYERASRVLDTAEEEGKTALSLAAIKELRGIVETLARITGELDERPTVTVNLAESPEWAAIQSVILAALGTFPEARRAVALALTSSDVIAGEVVA